jgi:F-type H+-transporting ATPase subunit gamma
MANFREYSARLASMSGMRRVTATMKMVAASHLHRAQAELRLPEPFAASLQGLLPVVKRLAFDKHRVCVQPPERGSRVLLVVMTANRGLCGAFNSAVVREVRRWVREQTQARGIAVEAIYAGQKGYAALRQEVGACMKPVNVTAHPKARETTVISRCAVEGFLANRYDEVWGVGNRFVSTMNHETKLRRLLPFQPARIAEAMAAAAEASPDVVKPVIEPADSRMIEAITRQWIHLDVYTALLNSVASEHASRVIAMENATVNLMRMEKELILMRNRARQAAITNELTEIVSGAESLG